MDIKLVVANIIGFIALLLWVGSIQLKHKNKIMIVQMLANIFYAIQYLVLGIVSAGVMNIVSTTRYYIYYKNEQKGKTNSIILLLAFVFVISIIAKMTVVNIIDLIPIGITLLYTYITWQKNTKIIRIGFIIGAVIWIYYNFYVGAYVAVIGNILEIISGIVAIVRFDKNKKR